MNADATDPVRPAFLAAVEARLEEVLAGDESGPSRDADDGTGALLRAARHLCLGGGKRVRPRLVLSFGVSTGADPARLVELGTAAELMHAASLLHDDVVDEGTLRRGRPTANALWGNTVAVLSGDLLLSLALRLLAPYPKAVLADAIQVVVEMSRGAMLEVASRGRADLPLDAWRAIAEAKTGELFAFCGTAAALLGGEAEAGERFARCGRRLGVAFQLADDLLDVLPGDAGKDRFSDLRTRSPSYPLLLAARDSREFHRELAAAWSGGDVSGARAQHLEKMVVASGAARRTWVAIGEEIAAAVEALGAYAARPGGSEVVAWAEALWRSARIEEAECAAG